MNLTREDLAAIGELIDQKSESLEKEIFAVRTHLDNLRDDVKVVKADIDVLKSDSGQIKKDVDRIKLDTFDLRLDMSSIKKEWMYAKDDLVRGMRVSKQSD